MRKDYYIVIEIEQKVSCISKEVEGFFCSAWKVREHLGATWPGTMSFRVQGYVLIMMYLLGSRLQGPHLVVIGGPNINRG